jgi:hypothetical protein
VFYFKTATVRGLVRLGKTPKDRTVGFVMMSSLDGKLLQSIIVDMDKHSHQDIGKILEPILSSFTFRLHERVSRAELGHLVQKAGIPAR